MLALQDFLALENGEITKKEFLEILKSKISEEKLKRVLYNVQYEDQLSKLQEELVNLQEWVTKHKKRVCIIFEGRDASGKGGSIRRMAEHLNPRSRRIVALTKPTEVERGQWYFRRYIKEMPNPGEIVFFDRSWYNRAVVEIIENTNDADLKITVDFFAGPKSKLQILNLLQDHLSHHRGQLIVYLNLNNIKPPSYIGW